MGTKGAGLENSLMSTTMQDFIEKHVPVIQIISDE